MMDGLMRRAEAVARAAQGRRLERIAERLRSQGLAAAIAADSVTCRGRIAVQKWLADPLVRFVGRMSE